ncbi:hypothetical protein K502DRAFT_363995 [Neoconidiobolus thromboides FSU 785]|nr:hypothetical protein K502DRAFT_363995 [Neoconidiobolus thromboides FSU 785]
MSYIPTVDPGLEDRLRRESEKTLRIDILLDKKNNFMNMLTALKNKKLPDNNQIDGLITNVTEKLEWRTIKPSKTTSKILHDTKSLVDESKVYFIERNNGDLIQQFITHLVYGGKQTTTLKMKTDNIKNLKNPSYKLYKSLVDLFKLSLSSSKLRRLLEEIYNVSKENIDKLLPEDTRLPSLSKTKEIVGTPKSTSKENGNLNGSPTIKSYVPHLETAPNKEKGFEIPITTGQFTESESSKSPSKVSTSLDNRPDIKLDMSRPEIVPIKQKGTNVPITTGEPTEPEPSKPRAEGQEVQIPSNKEELKEEAMGIVENLGDIMIGKGIEVTKPLIHDIEKSDEKPTKVIREKLQEVKKDLGGVRKNIGAIKLTEDQKDRLISRFYDFMKELQSNPKYHKNLDFIISVCNQVQKNMTEIGPTTYHILDKSNLNNDEIMMALKEAKKAIGKFLGDQSMTPLIRSVEKLYISLINDREMRKIFLQLNQDIIDFFKKPDYLKKDEAKKVFRNDFSLIKAHLQGNYKEKSDLVVSKWQMFIENIIKDKKLRSIAKKYRILYYDFFKKKGGKIQSSKVILSLLKDASKLSLKKVSNYEYIRIPRIESKVNSDQFIVDNIVLKRENLMNASLILKNTSKLDGQYKLVSDAIVIKIQNLNIEARSVAYFIKKSIGFFKFQDDGFIDISTPEGKGIIINLVISFPNISLNNAVSQSTSLENKIHVAACKVKIGGMKMKFHHNKHGILMKLLPPIVFPMIKSQIEKKISEEIKKNIEEVLEKTMSSFKKVSEQAIETAIENWRSELFAI